MSFIWKSCLLRLKKEIPADDFNSWIQPLHAVEQGSTLKLLAPNNFVIDHIKANFLVKIETIVNESCGGFCLVEFSIGSKKSTNNTGISPTKTNKKPQKPNTNYLNKTFSFDSFIEGKSNQLAKAAAQQVAENSGKSYNPLFIYGKSGLGKTHLMHAIGNYILQKNPGSNIVYLHSEKFASDMVAAFQKNAFDDFKQYYRNITVLLVDDVQFLGGKERSQEEFFHTFNTLFEKNHQLVLTCDRYPREIKNLEDRLKSRFGWGLTVAIEPPDLETRAAILKEKAVQFGVKLSSDAAFFIAKIIQSNVRELEGGLKRTIACANLNGSAITQDLIKKALRDLILLQNKSITTDNIKLTVAEYFKIKVSDLSGKSRKQSVLRPRQIAMCLARELTSCSFPQIGEDFGGKDHTTVINACKRIESLKKSDYKIMDDYQSLSRILL